MSPTNCFKRLLQLLPILVLTLTSNEVQYIHDLLS